MVGKQKVTRFLSAEAAHLGAKGLAANSTSQSSQLPNQNSRKPFASNRYDGSGAKIFVSDLFPVILERAMGIEPMPGIWAGNFTSSPCAVR